MSRGSVWWEIFRRRKIYISLRFRWIIRIRRRKRRKKFISYNNNTRIWNRFRKKKEWRMKRLERVWGRRWRSLRDIEMKRMIRWKLCRKRRKFLRIRLWIRIYFLIKFWVWRKRREGWENNRKRFRSCKNRLMNLMLRIFIIRIRCKLYIILYLYLYD